MPVKKAMSLLPDSENASSLVSRIIRWTTTAGRFVIVFTELIVITAFLSRFWLDRKNSDLSEVIRQQKAILESTADFEKEYNSLQSRLGFVKDYYAQAVNYGPCLATLAESAPQGVVFTNLTLTRTATLPQISLEAAVYQENTIIDFVTNLVSNPLFSSVEVKSIEKKPRDAKYLLNLTLVYQPQNQPKL
jgi:Tfp pilus assembly protein PilN